jgi:hypothetical protein
MRDRGSQSLLERRQDALYIGEYWPMSVEMKRVELGLRGGQGRELSGAIRHGWGVWFGIARSKG